MTFLFLVVALFLLPVDSVAQETMEPDTEVSESNLAGTFDRVQGGVDADLNTWRNHNSGSTAHQHVTFATPAQEPGGTQKFRVRVRKNSSGGGGDPTIVLELWAAGGGSPLGTSSAFDCTVTGSSGQVFEWDWEWDTHSASLAADGSDVEMRTTHNASPSPTRRCDLESMEWVAASVGGAVLMMTE